MTVLQCRREIRRFMERQRGGDGIYRNSFSRILIIKMDAAMQEEERKRLKRMRGN